MARPMGVMKHSNDYAHAVGVDFFNSIPKSVWAAIAVSFATNGGDSIDAATRLIAQEWDILYRNGIVPQPPNKMAKRNI